MFQLCTTKASTPASSNFKILLQASGVGGVPVRAVAAMLGASGAGAITAVVSEGGPVLGWLARGATVVPGACALGCVGFGEELVPAREVARNWLRGEEYAGHSSKK